MNTALIKQVLKYILLLALSIALLWFALRDLKPDELLNRMAEVNYTWVVLSILAAAASHLLRAWRWNMLLKPLGYTPFLGITFNSLMVGYMANFALPRFGEVARCGVLRKNAGVPVSSSFGTVLAERALDFIMLLIITAFTLFVEFDLLAAFLRDVFSGESKISTELLIGAMVALAVLGLIGLYLWRIYHLRLMKFTFYQKIIGFGSDLVAGLLSIRHLKQQGAFWSSTILIWVLYYLMTYLILFSLPHTSSLNFMAGMSLLAMGGIAMAAPVQGGIGAYHVLVSGVLILYGLSPADAAFLTLLMHTSQSVFVIAVGGICLLISLLLKTTVPAHEAKPAQL